MEVALPHVAVEGLQLGEHHQARVPHVLDLLVDEKRVSARAAAAVDAVDPGVLGSLPSLTTPGWPYHILLEYLFEFVLNKKNPLKYLQTKQMYFKLQCCTSNVIYRFRDEKLELNS